jgi:hypothetical protein
VALFLIVDCHVLSSCGHVQVLAPEELEPDINRFRMAFEYLFILALVLVTTAMLMNDDDTF